MLLKLPKRNIWQHIAKCYENTVAYEKGNHRFSYLQLHQITDSIAAQLSIIQIKNDSKVLLLLESQEIIIELIISLWKLGAIPIIANPQITNDELSQYNKIVNADFIITSSKKSVENIKHISVENLFVDNSNQINFDNTSMESQIILFSSGSTGYPKAILHTLKSIYKSVLNADSIEDYSSQDIFLSSLPIYHIGGLMIFFRSIFCGAKVVIPSSLKVEVLFETIIKSKVTIISLVPTQLFRFTKNKFESQSTLRSVYIGGDFAEKNLIKNALNYGLPIKKVYGSTETCSMISMIDCKKYPDKINSVGLPFKKVKLKLSSDGEILVKSDSLFKKYVNDDLLTQKSFIKGYFRTGDFGYIDEQGFIFIEKRKRNFIISGGKNIDPIEVEKALLSINGINRVLVFPFDDSEWGQIVCAAVESEVKFSFDEIKEKLSKIISSYKIPKRIKIFDKLPRNTLGKISISEIKKSFSELT